MTWMQDNLIFVKKAESVKICMYMGKIDIHAQEPVGDQMMFELQFKGEGFPKAKSH